MEREIPKYLYPSDKLYNYFVKTAHSHVTWAYNMHHLTHTSYYGKYIAYVDCKSGSNVKKKWSNPIVTLTEYILAKTYQKYPNTKIVKNAEISLFWLIFEMI